MKNIKITVLSVICITVLLLVTVFLGGCGESKPAEDSTPTQATIKDVFSAIVAVMPDSDKLTDVQDSYLSGFLKAKAEDFANYRIVAQTISTSIDEIGLFEAKSEDDIKKIEEMIDTFFAFRLNIWDPQYLPEEMPKLENAKRLTAGKYVLYIIADDETRAAVENAFATVCK